ncbi:hypothetical protein BayCH28_06910 [Mycolicibacterium sp. CH28]|uniref:hypothetical protein n=1 Tax=Mycolicibacterium sp. CH28 TaxID=2512237 RepID=UPI001081B4F2|nr:hypothetical protein [Mycolicibacterium sp. CH28]TGD89091.1 hypothetical protein BayCH28_06910 [Mycolicibacterium sp. CH28]
MSRQSDAKKARRKKRQAGRDARWIPDQVMETIVGDDFDDELGQAVETFDQWLVSRGWTFDSEYSTETLLSWYYSPSAAAEVDDDQVEPVTRIWITVAGAADDFPDGVTAVLVGTGGGRGALYTVAPEALLAQIEAVEAYRPGAPVPVLA